MGGIQNPVGFLSTQQQQQKEQQQSKHHTHNE
jgi:hypothetical protein